MIASTPFRSSMWGINVGMLIWNRVVSAGTRQGGESMREAVTGAAELVAGCSKPVAPALEPGPGSCQSKGASHIFLTCGVRTLQPTTSPGRGSDSSWGARRLKQVE
jgi:hypothetical protein